MSRPETPPDRSLVLAVGKGALAAIDVVTGEVAWQNDFEYRCDDFVVANDRVYAVTSNGHLYCLEYRTGNPLWTAELPGASANRQLLLDGARVFIEARGQLTCVDLDGKVSWTQELKGLGQRLETFGLPGNLRHATDS